MKDKVIKRGLVGAPLGVTISLLIALVISAVIGDGNFHPVAAELADAAGSELNAVIIQTVLSGLMGAGYAMASVIWEIDSWSLAKQSGLYFAITCVLMFPVAYCANWMEHSLAGFLTYAGIYVGIFVIVWLTQYCIWRKKIDELNAQVSNKAITD